MYYAEAFCFNVGAISFIYDNNISLDGEWTSLSNDIVISGSEAKFSEIKSGMWADGLSQGFIKENDLRLKNITKTGDYEWTCSVRAGNYDESQRIVTSVYWVDNCTLVLVPDEKTFTVKGVVPNASGDGEKELF